MTEITLIAAIAKNNVIGKNGKLPWDIPEDLEHFKTKTKYHPIIMGRTTYEFLPRKPLPNRTNVVLSRKNLELLGAIVKHSLDDAILFCQNEFPDKEIYVIGGSKIYELALPKATKLELTLIDREYEGDSYFPNIDFKEWDLVNEDKKEFYSFNTYVRKQNSDTN